jgi:hypothetical protein
MSNAQLKARLDLACIVTLLLGIGGALLAYATAGEEVEAAVSYVIVDGQAHPVAPQTSKRYLRDLEQFGGKASVLFDEFNRWFGALWHGRRLAVTVAVISIGAALGLFLFARWLPPDRE